MQKNTDKYQMYVCICIGIQYVCLAAVSINIRSRVTLLYFLFQPLCKKILSIFWEDHKKKSSEINWPLQEDGFEEEILRCLLKCCCTCQAKWEAERDKDQRSNTKGRQDWIQVRIIYILDFFGDIDQVLWTSNFLLHLWYCWR